jgi:hypothetical protein
LSGLLFPKRTCRALDKRDRQRERDTAWRKVVAAVKTRDGGRCRNCGAVGTDPHHIVPKSLGGASTTANVVWLDRSCHDLCQQHYLRIIGDNADKRLVFEVSTWMR